MRANSPQTIHEATFLADGRVIDQVSVRVRDLDAQWIDYYEDLLEQGGGGLCQELPEWQLIVQQQVGSFGVASLAVGERCLCSMLFLSGKDPQDENRVIYGVLQQLARLTRPDRRLMEPDFGLLALKQRPLLAVALFPGADERASLFALDTSVFLAAAWFDLHGS